MLLLADETKNFCSTLSPLIQIVGWILFVFKIVIPILIIVFGMIDLGKAVVASKDDEVKKSIKSLAMRAIAGVVIFFVPTLVGAVFGLVGEFSRDGAYKTEYEKCKACIVNPGGGTCTHAVSVENGTEEETDDEKTGG